MIDQATQGKHGGDRKSEHIKSDNVKLGFPAGNTRQHALRKFRKDRPDLHVQVLKGKLTPHAAMVKASWFSVSRPHARGFYAIGQRLARRCEITPTRERLLRLLRPSGGGGQNHAHTREASTRGTWAIRKARRSRPHARGFCQSERGRPREASPVRYSRQRGLDRASFYVPLDEGLKTPEDDGGGLTPLK